MENIRLRKAETKDIPFLIKAIIEADKSNTSRSSYCNLLGISEKAFETGLYNIFEEELDHCEFGHSSFAVIEDGGNCVGACAGWIEGEDGLASWQLRMMALQSVFSTEEIQHFIEKAKLFSTISLPRSVGTLQIESVFIEEKYRGKGLLLKLIEFHINFAAQRGVPFQWVELLTYQNNEMAEKAYQKIGFYPVAHSKCDDTNVLSFYPASGMTLWRKNHD